MSLVSEATSFGGVHSTAERRARWGSDDVPEGFIRFSCGIEDTEDLVADVLQALASTMKGPPGGGPFTCWWRMAAGQTASAARGRPRGEGWAAPS